MTRMRGYFGLGVEGLNKPMNAGTILRTAHSFGASFIFAVAPDVDMRGIKASDTSGTADQIPYYQWTAPGTMALPKGCRLVGIELTEDAIDLPSFRHPDRAAYVLGPERGSLTPEMLSQCDHVIKIPISFCVNVAIAGAIVLYDRMLSRGRFAERPVGAGGPMEALKPHVQGGQVFRRKRAAARKKAAKAD